jgi:hypothetical protein
MIYGCTYAKFKDENYSSQMISLLQVDVLEEDILTTHTWDESMNIKYVALFSSKVSCSIKFSNQAWEVFRFI